MIFLLNKLFYELKIYTLVTVLEGNKPNRNPDNDSRQKNKSTNNEKN